MTSRPARLNVKTFISRDNFLLGCRRVKHLPIVYWSVLRYTTICFLATRNHYLFQTDTCSALTVAAGDFVRF